MSALSEWKVRLFTLAMTVPLSATWWMRADRSAKSERIVSRCPGVVGPGTARACPMEEIAREAGLRRRHALPGIFRIGGRFSRHRDQRPGADAGGWPRRGREDIPRWDGCAAQDDRLSMSGHMALIRSRPGRGESEAVRELGRQNQRDARGTIARQAPGRGVGTHRHLTRRRGPAARDRGLPARSALRRQPSTTVILDGLKA